MSRSVTEEYFLRAKQFLEANCGDCMGGTKEGLEKGINKLLPDSSFMYYMKDQKLYTVILLNPEAPAIRVLPEDLETYWSVLFADR